MNKKIILPFVVLMVLAMVGAASALTTADEVKIRGTVVQEINGGNITVAGGGLITPGYIWDPYNFAAFWYDLDDDMKSEMLRINTTLTGSDNRTIPEDQLIYNTTPQIQEYQYTTDHNGTSLGTVSGNPVTDYYVEGWMAEKYVAISTGGSTNANANKIVKLLVEFESSSDKKTLATEEAWDLGGGFTLTAKQIDLQGDKVWLSLAKNDKEIDDAVIDAGSDRRYMYTEDLSGVSDVVVFFCNIGAVFRGTESNLVQVEYVFMINNDVEKIETSTTYGNMEVKTASGDEVILKNDGSIDLSPNTDVEIMKDMYFKVADNDTVVRFYPYKLYTEPGDYDIRGTVVEECAGGSIQEAGTTVCGVSYTWDPYNFAAFWYDLDDDMKSEMLRINASLTGANQTIPEDQLIYNTTPQIQEYQYTTDHNGTSLGTVSGNPVTDYYVEGWMAEKYVAISTGGSTNANANKIVKLLVEFESSSDKKTLATEEAWDLGGGFTLTAKQIDLQGDKVWLSLAKNDKEIDDAVIDAGSDRRYMYTEDLSGVSDVVVFFCNIGAVFRGTESNLVQVEYVFMINNDVEKIETSTTYGNMEVKTASGDEVILKNDGSIDLSPNTDVEIMKDMYFKVADNATVTRFYPYKVVTIEGAAAVVDDEVDEDETPTNVTADVNVTPTAVVTPTAEPSPTAPEDDVTADDADDAEPTATEKKTPGFEAIFAIAGLLAVAYLVLRQRE